MPISDDEYDHHPVQQPHTTMSKAELRKTHKPIMEKRRRARINQCLNEIKTLILEAMNKDPARHSKLEKADILEMAVKHLQNVQRQQLAMAMATDPGVLRKFKSGFNECTNEIDRYISSMEGVDVGLKERMINHLQKSINSIEHVAHFNLPNFLPFLHTPSTTTTTTTPPTPFIRNQTETSTTSGDQNSNATRIQIPQSIQLIPSRLPSGEIALLLPNSSNLPLFPTLTTERSSAFAAVIPSSSSSSSVTTTRTQSPRPESPPLQGFRPVQPSKSLEQIHQVSSSDIKMFKFPIHCIYEEKKKPVEPLCVITNQSERYKQAQTREDSVNYEENRRQGVKREFSETVTSSTITKHQGLLTIATQQECTSSEKKLKKPNECGESSKDCSNNDNSDMWRPW